MDLTGPYAASGPTHGHAFVLVNWDPFQPSIGPATSKPNSELV